VTRRGGPPRPRAASRPSAASTSTKNDSRCQAAASALRASHINGCGWCVDLHTKEAAAAGETAVQLNPAAAWREAAVFTEGYVYLPATRVLHAAVTPEIWAVLAGGAAWACPA